MLTLPNGLYPYSMPRCFATRPAESPNLVGAILATHRGIGAPCHGTQRRPQLCPLSSSAQSGGVVAPPGGTHPVGTANPPLGSRRWSVDLRHRRNPGAAPRPQNQIPGHLPRCGTLQPVSGGQGQRCAGTGQVPWAGRYWALPFLTVLAPSARYHRQRGRRHKKLTDWARQMILQLRRWLPHVPWCWWATAATPSSTCSTAANRWRNPLRSSPACAWTPRTGPAPSAGPERSAPAERPTAARAEITRRPWSVLDHRRGSLVQRRYPHGGTHLARRSGIARASRPCPCARSWLGTPQGEFATQALVH